MASVVISYARVDQPLVRVVVKLLRAAMREFEDPVYWDEDFEPGDAWLDQIKRSIDCTPQLFVFWCAHSANSPQVAEEFRYALHSGKRVVPILLDQTDLIPDLARIHGVDLREAVRHRGPMESGTFAPASPVPAPSIQLPRASAESGPTKQAAQAPLPQKGRVTEIDRRRAKLGDSMVWLVILLGGAIAVAVAALSASPATAMWIAFVFGCLSLLVAWLTFKDRKRAALRTEQLPYPQPRLEPQPPPWEDIQRSQRERQEREVLDSIDADALLTAFRRGLRSRG